jgi:hypothetical protein
MDGFFERRLSDVVERFSREGYRDTFRGEPQGVRALGTGLLHAPEDLVLEAAERFEGISDPEEMAIVLAVRCRPHGCQGTYVLPYGKDMPTVDGDLVRRIPDVRKR